MPVLKCYLVLVFFLSSILFAETGIDFSKVIMHPQETITGFWLDDQERVVIEIYKDKKGFYSGKIAWLKMEHESQENVLDTKNSNKNLRERKLKGLSILKNLKFQPVEFFQVKLKNYRSGGTYEDGEIYNPFSGNKYDVDITLLGKDKLKMRGYLFFRLLGETIFWNRQKSSIPDKFKIITKRNQSL